MLRPRSVRPQLALCGFRIYKKIELGFSSNCLSDFPLYRFGFHGNKHVPGNCARAPLKRGRGKRLGTYRYLSGISHREATADSRKDDKGEPEPRFREIAIRADIATSPMCHDFEGKQNDFLLSFEIVAK